MYCGRLGGGLSFNGATLVGKTPVIAAAEMTSSSTKRIASFGLHAM
jgi:hypothetical protein